MNAATPTPPTPPTPNTPAPKVIDDLFVLTLVDGLSATSDGKSIQYKTVHLRETTVADERIAQRAAERVVMVGGTPQLMVSDAEFRYQMTLRHIAAFACDGLKIDQALLDVDMLGKLSSHDLGLIEERVFLIEMAAQVRYGAITQDEVDALLGKAPKEPQSPQRAGQAAGVGQAPAGDQSVPAMLADLTRAPADRAPAGHGG